MAAASCCLGAPRRFQGTPSPVIYSGALFTHRASVTPTHDLPTWRGYLASREQLIEPLTLHCVVAEVEVQSDLIEHAGNNLRLDCLDARRIGMFMRAPPAICGALLDGAAQTG
jgi:hypothetical protein